MYWLEVGSDECEVRCDDGFKCFRPGAFSKPFVCAESANLLNSNHIPDVKNFLWWKLFFVFCIMVLLLVDILILLGIWRFTLSKIKGFESKLAGASTKCDNSIKMCEVAKGEEKLAECPKFVCDMKTVDDTSSVYAFDYPAEEEEKLVDNDYNYGSGFGLGLY